MHISGYGFSSLKCTSSTITDNSLSAFVKRTWRTHFCICTRHKTTNVRFLRSHLSMLGRECTRDTAVSTQQEAAGSLANKRTSCTYCTTRIHWLFAEYRTVLKISVCDLRGHRARDRNRSSTCVLSAGGSVFAVVLRACLSIKTQISSATNAALNVTRMSHIW